MNADTLDREQIAAMESALSSEWKHLFDADDAETIEYRASGKPIAKLHRCAHRLLPFFVERSTCCRLCGWHWVLE